MFFIYTCFQDPQYFFLHILTIYVQTIYLLTWDSYLVSRNHRTGMLIYSIGFELPCYHRWASVLHQVETKKIVLNTPLPLQRQKIVLLLLAGTKKPIKIPPLLKDYTFVPTGQIFGENIRKILKTVDNTGADCLVFPRSKIIYTYMYCLAITSYTSPQKICNCYIITVTSCITRKPVYAFTRYVSKLDKQFQSALM